MDTTTKMFLIAFGFPLGFILFFIIIAYILKLVTPTIEKFSKKKAAVKAAKKKEFKATYGKFGNTIEERADTIGEWAYIIDDGEDRPLGTITPREEAAINKTFLKAENFLSWLNLEKHPIRIIFVVIAVILLPIGIAILNNPEFIIEHGETILNEIKYLISGNGERIILPQ